MTERIVTAGVGDTSSLLLLALVVLVMFWMVLSQRRRAKATQVLQDSMKPGDEVVNAAGIFGTLRGGTGRRAVVEVAPGVLLEMDRQQLVPVPVPEHLRTHAPAPSPDPAGQQTPPEQDTTTPQEH